MGIRKAIVKNIQKKLDKSARDAKKADVFLPGIGKVTSEAAKAFRKATKAEKSKVRSWKQTKAGKAKK